MRKKDTLYKANKWNKDKPLFMLEDENIFWPGGQMDSSNPFGISLTAPTVENPIYKQIDFSNPIQKAAVLGTTKGLVEGFGDYAQQANALNIGSTAASNVGKGILGGLGKGLLGKNSGMGAMASIAGDVVGNLIGGGYSSGVGNALGSLGKVASVIPGPWGAAASFGLQTVGGAVNALWGTKVDEQALKENKEGNNQLLSFSSNAGSFDAIKGPQGVANVKNVYSGGVFKKGWAEEKNKEQWNSRAEAVGKAYRGQENNVGNLESDQLNNALASYKALGGPLDAVGLDLAYDALNIKRKNAQNKDKMTNLFMGTPSLFAFGGDMETNGSDFPTGLMHIGAGGSHESNPNDGVQLGVDQEGTPNLVEENETVFNDYVYSARINLDAQAKEKFHFPKKKDITYAEATKKLEKEIAERPNDPLSKASFKAQMETLANEQERQKQEMEAERAKAAFEALSPEEQTAIMQRAAQEEAMAQEAMAQQQVAEQSGAQINPEEAAMAQQQMMQADGSEAVLGAEPDLAQLQANVSALGGELVRAGDVEGNKNIYAFAGTLNKRQNRKLASRYSEDWFKQQAKALGINDELMSQFKFNPNDAEGNLSAFNEIYRTSQYNNALQTYRTGQKQARRNELFDSKTGRYRKSDNGSKIYEARYRQEGQDWMDTNNKIISQKDYEGLSDKEKEAFQQIKTKVGDKLYDNKGNLLETEYNGTEDSLLNDPSYDYSKGFKWNDKDAQTLQYPVEMEHSGLSNLRYVPGLAGAIGLGYDLLNPADYSRAEAVQNIGSYAPNTVTPNYRGNYLRYEPVDPWFWEAPILANSRASARAIQNSGANQGAKNAAQLGLDYNTNIALGQAGLNGQIQNFERKYKTTAFNNDLDKAYMNLDMQAQMANQKALSDAAENNSKYRYIGLSMMDDIDARKNASINANLTNLMTSIGNIGEEAYDEDRLKWLEKTGVLKSNYFGNVACNGGKIKRSKLKL